MGRTKRDSELFIQLGNGDSICVPPDGCLQTGAKTCSDCPYETDCYFDERNETAARKSIFITAPVDKKYLPLDF